MGLGGKKLVLADRLDIDFEARREVKADSKDFGQNKWPSGAAFY